MLFKRGLTSCGGGGGGGNHRRSRCCVGGGGGSSWILLHVGLLLTAVVTVHGFDEINLPVSLKLEPENRIYVAANTKFSGSGIVDLAYLNITIFPVDDASLNENPSSEEATTVYFDIVLVKSPDDCYSQEGGCSWSDDLGIGIAQDGGEDENIVYYCCSKEALQAKLCNQEQYGRLLFRPDVFTGKVREVSVTVPVDKEVTVTIENPEYIEIQKPGFYSILMANCNIENGPRGVVVDGYTIWVSDEDELQTFFRENVPFYTIMTILYASLFGWYVYHMRLNQNSRIPLEEWIRIIIALGLASSLFDVLEFALLKRDQYGTVAHVVIGFGSSLAGIKHGLSRSLLLMLSLGWGVVYPSLSSILTTGIVALGVVYCILEGLEDFMYVIGHNNPSPFLNFCYLGSMMIDFLFWVWIPLSLCKTMKYLKESNQLRKLERYRKLLYILALAVFLTIFLILLIFLDAILDKSKELSLYNVGQGNDVNFFLIMVCVAVLWKPNPMAREFAYAMELSWQEIDGDDSGRGGGPLGMNGREGYLADLEMTENNNADSQDDSLDGNGSFTNRSSREIS